MTVRTLAAAALVALIGTALAQPPNPAGGGRPVAAPVPQPPNGDPKAEKGDIAKQLATRVTADKFEGKFGEAVERLAEKYDLPLVLTRRAAEWRGSNDDADAKLADQAVTLPRLTNVKAETVLALLCEQTQTRYLISPGCIKIVPDIFAVYETGIVAATKDPTAYAGDDESALLTTVDLIRTKPLTKRALVNAAFKNKPLGEAIDEIVEATGANVAVSPLLPANVRQAPITVRFANTPVDAAVRTLCEMTECGVIEDANVLLVTTVERAAARAKDEAQKAKDRRPAPQPILWPAQPGFGGSQGHADLAAEVAKLKEQNEQLKKQLDQMEKLLKKPADK
jgi:hypothetical protein